MKITIETTSKIVELLDGRTTMRARVWEGQTESGIPVHCFVTRIAPTVADTPENEKVYAEFERELKEQRRPTPAVDAIPARLIL